MTAIRIDIDDRQFVEYFQEVGRRLGRMEPVMDRIGATLESRVNLRFSTKTDPTGAHWQPWAKSTEKRRVKEGRGSLLEHTRRMLDSLTHDATDDAATVGFGVPYAAAHEFGAKIERAARSQRAAFKVDMQTGQSRFARRSKANFEQWVTIGAHTQTIPPRRMLTADGTNLGAADAEAVAAILSQYLTPP